MKTWANSLTRSCRSGWVYYLGNGHSRVKIGYSNNPKARLNTARCFHPHLQLLAVERGTKATERQRHEQFKADRRKGEWFKKTDQIADWIGLLTAINRIEALGPMLRRRNQQAEWEAS